MRILAVDLLTFLMICPPITSQGCTSLRAYRDHTQNQYLYHKTAHWFLPYKELRYYESEDELLFFGREADKYYLLQQVFANRLTILTGQVELVKAHC